MGLGKYSKATQFVGQALLGLPSKGLFKGQRATLVAMALGAAEESLCIDRGSKTLAHPDIAATILLTLTRAVPMERGLGFDALVQRLSSNTWAHCGRAGTRDRSDAAHRNRARETLLAKMCVECTNHPALCMGCLLLMPRHA